MASPASLETARDAFARQDWGAVRSSYALLLDDASFTLDDLERYATAAHLLGDEATRREMQARGFMESVRLDDVSRAARFAFWLGHAMIFTGEMGQAAGWFGRARTLLAERGADCVEWGYLMIPAGIEQLEAGDAAGACTTFTEAQIIGRRFADQDLPAMAGHGRGRALIRLGLAGEGMAVLDEVMVMVAAGEVSPIIVGDIYCGVLEACQEVLDFRRAREWTIALSQWCDGQPDLVPYRGPCLVHRVELMCLRGDWEDALEEARRACDWLSMPDSPEGPGDALYQLGELYRLRGDFAKAEAAYRHASQEGRPTEPGLPLLWLASGRGEAAYAAIRRALEESSAEGAKRATLLAGYIEILLAQKGVAEARRATAELAEIAESLGALPLKALADRADGNVMIAEARASDALTPLRRSWKAWQQLDAPYEAARVRVLIGAACRQLGDEESAAMEMDAARTVFERLGAQPDILRLLHDRDAETVMISALTAREVEVLIKVAAGETNKSIAAALVISEHTVARHLQNMFQKLGFSSRASLAAYAVEQGYAHGTPGQN